MKELTIPSTHYPLFKSFIELPKEIKEQIAEHLKLAPLGLSPSSLVDFLSSGIENLSKEKISEITSVKRIQNLKKKDYTYDFKKIKKTQPKNFNEWVLQSFGAGFGKHFFFPYQEKIFSYNTKN